MQRIREALDHSEVSLRLHFFSDKDVVAHIGKRLKEINNLRNRVDNAISDGFEIQRYFTDDGSEFRK